MNAMPNMPFFAIRFRRVIPAQAGIQYGAGHTGKVLDSRLRGNDAFGGLLLKSLLLL